MGFDILSIVFRRWEGPEMESNTVQEYYFFRQVSNTQLHNHKMHAVNPQPEVQGLVWETRSATWHISTQVLDKYFRI